MRVVLILFCLILLSCGNISFANTENEITTLESQQETATEQYDYHQDDSSFEEIDANTLDSDGKLLVRVYQNKSKFGLEKTDGTIITKAIYKKIIRLGDKSWIVQYKNKFGLIDYYGNYIIFPKYRNVQRIANRFVKFGNDNDYGLYDEHGFTIIQPEFSSIDLLYGKMFLTRKNFRYGIVDLEGNTLLENEFDDIYMPQPNVMLVQYEGNWSKIERLSEKEITLPEDLNSIAQDKDFKITNLVVNTGVGAGYSVVTLTDYLLKMISSISPAYEATIDELMYSQGADTISILMKLSWLPKFPIVYIKQYYRHLRSPNNGPLANTRSTLKKQLR